MQNESELDLANREFERILPVKSRSYDERLRSSFQIFMLAPGLPNIGQRAYTPPGSWPYQTGPSPVTNLFSNPSAPGGEGGSPLDPFVNPNVPHPDSEPPTGPEERIRYSCVSGYCLQDPNGVYYGIDECLADGCGSDTGGGGGGKGCDCGCGPAHTVFKAEITGIVGVATGNITAGGRHYWDYTWTEVTPSAVIRDSSVYGTATNEYELTVDDDGDNVVPPSATLERRRIPDDTIVTMVLDESCTPWFTMLNPLTVICGE